eukprot:404305-Rhodomonas_salina.1
MHCPTGRSILRVERRGDSCIGRDTHWPVERVCTSHVQGAVQNVCRSPVYLTLTSHTFAPRRSMALCGHTYRDVTPAPPCTKKKCSS